MLKDQLNRILYRVGYEISRPLSGTAKLLDHYGINCVVDVGANDGGFGTAVRHCGYTGRILSFEPLQEPFKALRQKAISDGNWETFQCAVGDASAEVTMNVSGNKGRSSSVLPMLEAHIDAAPQARYVGTETIRQERLDALLPRFGLTSSSRTFLKVDVQGYERAVLDGASGLFADGSIIGLQLELSLVPLYDGAMTFREGLERANNLGMTLMRLDPMFDDPTSGQTLQVDAVFIAAKAAGFSAARGN